MPSPYLERGDMAIIVLPAIALTTFDKERNDKRQRDQVASKAKLSRQWLLPAQFSNVLFDLLQKTFNNECSCAENTGSASIHDQSFTFSNL
jgi:hypothetical protein